MRSTFAVTTAVILLAGNFHGSWARYGLLEQPENDVLTFMGIAGSLNHFHQVAIKDEKALEVLATYILMKILRPGFDKALDYMRTHIVTSDGETHSEFDRLLVVELDVLMNEYDNVLMDSTVRNKLMDAVPPHVKEQLMSKISSLFNVFVKVNMKRVKLPVKRILKKMPVSH